MLFNNKFALLGKSGGNRKENQWQKHHINQPPERKI
jgi:hypothetical protein